MKTNTNTRTETTNRLADLMEHRNALLQALDRFPNLAELTESREKTVHELCETIAQIAVYKTLLHLANSVTSFSATETNESAPHRQTITTSGADYCDKLYRQFAHDMSIYRTGNLTEIYTDAMDLFTLAYVTLWQYLRTSAPLTLDDIVLTIPKKNGDEKNYTLFQTACKSIRDYIHEWSNTDGYKKLHYIIGITEDGKQVTTSKRPQDDITDITEEDRTAFLNRYGLTALEEETARLLINGESADSIAKLLNIPPRTARDRVQKTKAKFKTANLYAEYVTAKNAEKVAKAKATKHEEDRIYQRAYAQAQERTAKALQEWKTAFHKANKR